MSKMILPSFDDFLLDMGEDRIAQWANDANDAIAELMPVKVPITAEAANEFANSLTVLNQQITLAMLRDYHEWLIEQLSKKSLHLL